MGSGEIFYHRDQMEGRYRAMQEALEDIWKQGMWGLSDCMYGNESWDHHENVISLAEKFLPYTGTDERCDNCGELLYIKNDDESKLFCCGCDSVTEKCPDCFEMFIGTCPYCE